MFLDIDLADPRWHMSRKLNDGIQTADIRAFQDRREWFRLVYRSEEQAGTLANTDGHDSKVAGGTPDSNASETPFWQGDLVSQAFSAGGQVD